MTKSFNEFHAKGTIELQESGEQFHERVIKHQSIDDKRYPDLMHAGLEGPYSDLNGKVYYYDTREGLYYDPDTDVYITHKDLRLP